MYQLNHPHITLKESTKELIEEKVNILMDKNSNFIKNITIRITKNSPDEIKADIKIHIKDKILEASTINANLKTAFIETANKVGRQLRKHKTMILAKRDIEPKINLE